jgi:hypothetical protein
MGGRKNAVICCFGKDSPKISAYEIHEWIHDSLRPDEIDVNALNIIGLKSQVLIKFTSNDKAANFLKRTPDTVRYTHTN